MSENMQVAATTGPALASRPEGDPAARRYVLTPDFDLLQPEILRDPYPLYRQLQEEQPVFWSNQMDAWVLTKHADVDGALRNPGLFSSEGRIRKILFGYVDRRLRGVPLAPVLRPVMRRLALVKMREFLGMATRFMWQRDPPDHTRLRKLMHQGFTSAMVTQMRPKIEDRVHGLLDHVSETGQMDFMGQFAVPLPAMFVADIYGVPDDWRQLQRWENDLKLFLGARRGSPGEAQKQALSSVSRMKEYFLEKIRERRKHPGDDLISRLAATDEDGLYLDDLELCANLMVTLGAAQVTTQDMLGNGLLALLRHPAQMQELIAERSLIPDAIDEIIRYDGPVQLTNRVLTEDTELRGKRLGEGQMAYLIRGAANRDPERFPDPDRFDIRRETRGHVAFGAGIHYCIGAALARVEGEIAFQAVFDRLPGLRLAAGDAVAWRADNLQFRGLGRFALEFEPTPRRG
jgi:cytochrome P450